MSGMIEKVAKAILKARFYDCEPEMYSNDLATFYAELDDEHFESAHSEARAAIEAMREPSDEFLHALAERMHDARFSRSGEDYPIARNFIRSFVDAALSEVDG